MAAKSNITKGALISYVAIFINIVISFVYTPWMIHKIGTADYGLYSLVIAFVSYFLLDFVVFSQYNQYTQLALSFKHVYGEVRYADRFFC